MEANGVVQQDAFLLTSKPDLRFLQKEVLGQAVPFHERLSSEKRRSRNSPLDILSLLALTLACVATIYLVLSCFRRLNSGFRRITGYRGLAAGGWHSFPMCAGVSGGQEEDVEGKAFFAGNRPSVVLRGEHGVSGRPGRVEVEPELAAVCTSAGGAAAAVARAAAGGFEDSQQVPAVTWSFWGMPRKTASKANQLLASFGRLTDLCAEVVPLVNPEQACMLVDVVGRLTAVELSSFSLFPVEHEDKRQRVLAGTVSLLCRTGAAAAAYLHAPTIRFGIERMNVLAQLLSEMRTPCGPPPHLPPEAYCKKAWTVLKLSRMSNAYASAVLRNLSFELKRAYEAHSKELVEQSLAALAAVYRTRLRQVLADLTVRHCLVRSQQRIRHWLLFSLSDLQASGRLKFIAPLDQQARDLSLAFLNANGPHVMGWCDDAVETAGALAMQGLLEAEGNEQSKIKTADQQEDAMLPFVQMVAIQQSTRYGGADAGAGNGARRSVRGGGIPCTQPSPEGFLAHGRQISAVASRIMQVQESSHSTSPVEQSEGSSRLAVLLMPFTRWANTPTALQREQQILRTSDTGGNESSDFISRLSPWFLFGSRSEGHFSDDRHREDTGQKDGKAHQDRPY